MKLALGDLMPQMNIFAGRHGPKRFKAKGRGNERPFVCAHCGETVLVPDQRCVVCGKRQLEHPSAT